MDLNTSTRVDTLLAGIEEQIIMQQAKIKNQKMIEQSIEEFKQTIKTKSDDLDIVTNAVAILSSVSDESVSANYKFIEDNVNIALQRVFPDKVRQIKLSESMRGAYPQLEFRMVTENGIVRTIKSDSGHGIAQIVSILCLLSLIVIRGERKFVALDEMTSGMSGNTRAVLDSILWAFAEIGFQFLLVDHGYVPKGAKVYILKDTNGIGRVEKSYIEQKGVYNEGKRSRQNYDLISTNVDMDIAEIE